jgi:hypothetical protein
MYDHLKENKGFFSPRQYKPNIEPGIDWYYKPTVTTWFTEPMIEKLIHTLDDYGYSVHADNHDSAQFNHAFRLDLSW